MSFTVNTPNTSDWRPPKPGGSKPQGIVYACPEAMLKAIVRHGFKSTSEMCGDPICFYCHGDMPTHDEDCLYIQIKEYLEETGRL